MLTEVRINNFAIIEKQEISFGKGLNVISGETGAGKSIVLHALELLLGGKLKVQSIRDGAESLTVEALFDLRKIDPAIIETLPEVARAEELILSRTVQRTGRSKILINGHLGSLTLLEEISEKLISLCGQSQHVKLLDPLYHQNFVDGFSKSEEALLKYKEVYEEWRKKRDQLKKWIDDEAQFARRTVELDAVIEELSKIPLSLGIREKLEIEVKRLGNSEKIAGVLLQAKDMMLQAGGLLESISRIGAVLHSVVKLDPGFQDVADEFLVADRAMSDVDRSIVRYLDSLDMNEELLNEKREQLAEIARLERKYKTTAEGLQRILESSIKERESYGNMGSVESMQQEVEKLLVETKTKGKLLSEIRKKGAKKLSAQVEEELSEVKLNGAKFEVIFTECEPHQGGLEKIEFFLSTNSGETPKPLRQIASGGELSRITLVLKKVLRDQSGVNVLVFDEVDTGISGAVARAVGKKLHALAEHSQVICITHLPQVASLADVHLWVDKVVGERTLSVIRELTSEERVEEIARMLAGKKVTPAARASAEELLRGE